jgi:diguanylate cyclase (GGDEF)-like protein
LVIQTEKTGASGIEEYPDRLLSLELPPEHVQALENAARVQWPPTRLPASLQADFESYRRISSRVPRAVGAAIPLVFYLLSPMWAQLLDPLNPANFPWLLAAFFGAISAMYLLLLYLLIRLPTRPVIDSLLLIAFLSNAALVEFIRYHFHIDRELVTPVITVTIPVTALALMRISLQRAAIFAGVYLVILLTLQWAFDNPPNARTPTLWLLESILLVVVLMASAAWQLAERRFWAAGILITMLAFRDGLTGLPNRRALDEHFERLSRLAQRQNTHGMYLALIDLDHFKSINDSYGHAYGDEVLSAIGPLLARAARRPLDIAARIGGEEFALLLYDCPPEAGAQRIDAVLEQIRSLALEHRGSPLNIVTASAGGAVVATGMLLSEGLRTADRALYEAKVGGRNRFCW